MEKHNKNKEYYTIDVLYVVKSLWKRIWIVVLCGIMTAAIGFLISAFCITPTYSSNIKLYVNNKSFSLETTNPSISISDLTAAQSLVKTYGEILNSRTTLERVIEKSGVDYSWKELSEMIECSASNNTEIMLVTVTCEDPYVASNIANTIADVLPQRISEIIDGASMKIVDSAIPDLEKVAPSITTFTAIGLALGIVLSVIVLIIVALFKTT